MKVLFLKNTNIRRTPADLSLAPVGIVYKGTELFVENQLYQGEEFEGVSTYFRDGNGWYYWSGMAQVENVPQIKATRESPSFAFTDSEELVPEPDPLPIQISPSEIPSLLDSDELEGMDEEANPLDSNLHEDGTSEVSMDKSSPNTITTQTAFPTTPPTKENDNLEQPEEGISPVNIQTQTTTPETNSSELFLDQDSGSSRTPNYRQKSTGKNIRILLITSGLLANTQNYKPQQIKQQSFGSSQAAKSQLLTPLFVESLLGRDRDDCTFSLPNAHLLIASLSTQDHTSPYAAFEAAIQWGIQQNVDLIINIFAWKKSVFSFEELLSLEKLTKQAENHNILWINACGDDREGRPEARFPARFSRVLSIGAFDEETKQAFYSVKSHTLDFLVPVDKTVLARFLSGSQNQEFVSIVSGLAALVGGGMVGGYMDNLKQRGEDVQIGQITALLKQKADQQYQLIKPRDVAFGWGVLRNVNRN